MGGGFTVWFTGLSGAGKSTTARGVAAALQARGRACELLDGDEVRTHLSAGLGFSRADRDINVRRIGWVARMLNRHGIVAIGAAISPYRAVREELRRDIDPFVEVYCEAPLAVLQQRDPKQLYRRAMAGEIRHLTGIDDPYEPPHAPEVHLRTDRAGPADGIDAVLAACAARGLI